jgi:hypothetical protein
MKQARKVFNAQDDEELSRLVRSLTEENWTYVAQNMSRLFTSRQCRERWRNYLDPRLQHVSWTDTDDARLLDDYTRLGTRWTVIAAGFPGRSGNSVRNRIFLLLRKKDKVPYPNPNQVRLPSPGPPSEPFRDLFTFSESENIPEPDRDDPIVGLFTGLPTVKIDNLF